jgi:alginate O-acetyltransferase complex protein AlgI
MRRPRIGIGILVASSLFFYGYWSPTYLALIGFSVLFNFFWARYMIAGYPHRRWPLIVGIIVNLGLLSYFKYTNFLLDNFDYLFGTDFQVSSIVLPLGISFFTFQQVSYLVDYKRGLAKEHSFLNYTLFVCFFPQLVAGPIVHHAEMIPQFARSDTFRFKSQNLAIGISTFIIGLFKKVVIADTLSPYSAELFDATGTPGLVPAWIGAIAYTLQIYFDFSGYSDMAIGLGKMFNIDIPINFNSPYKSTSITDFWRRWHMTLSRFLKDYLYIPLGGNRKGPSRRYVNLMITMVLGGLWHGAAWTFVLWGGLHGLFLCINHGWASLSRKLGFSTPKVAAWLITFVSVILAWVFFRAPTLDRAITITKGMAGINGLGDFSIFDERIILLALLTGMALALPAGWQWARRTNLKTSTVSAIGVGIMLVFSLLSLTRISEFLYFQF